MVVAVGRGDTTGATASSGMIGALAGPWRTWRGGELDRYVRLDGGLYPGFSGAPAVDAQGRVVGICTAALARAAGMVIPASTVDRVVGELLARGRVARAYLGLAMQPVTLPKALVQKLSLRAERGLLIVAVEPDGPADQAGVLIGD